MRCLYCGAPRRLAGNRCAACGGSMRATASVAAVSSTPAAMVSPDGALVLYPGTPLRDRARGPAAVLQTLEPGEPVSVLGRSGKYMRVRTRDGVDGYVDSVQLGDRDSLPPVTADSAPQEASEPTPPSFPEGADGRADLPFGMVGLVGESVTYIGKFIYDPFNDRAFVVTSHRVIIGGGGAPMPRVVERAEIRSARMREGSNGMALGERTLVLEVAHLPGETYISGLRDPERALASLDSQLHDVAGDSGSPS